MKSKGLDFSSVIAYDIDEYKQQQYDILAEGLRKSLDMAGAFIFIISSLKIPSVTGSCSHMTGTGLGALLFGPSSMSVLGIIVLIFQAILLAHGGITTLGANTFSMAIAGPFAAYGIYRICQLLRVNRKVSVFLAAFIGDIFTYCVTSFQLAMRAQWETEKKAISDVKMIKEQIEDVKHQMDEAERSYDLEKLAKLKYGTLPELEKQLETSKVKVESSNEQRLLKEEVGEEEIAEVVSQWTGIPVAKLVETEREKLLKLPEILHKRVVGQEEGVQAVADAILRARAGLKDENRPIGSFIFLGPTGVGKTELAKALSESLFDTEKNMDSSSGRFAGYPA